MIRVSTILFFVAFASLDAFAQSATEFGSSIARTGVQSANGSLSDLNAEEQLGVTASGGGSNGGRSLTVNYGQVFNGQIECPVEVGTAGRRKGISQFQSQCVTQSGSFREVWLCIPGNVNDTMSASCEGGFWSSNNLSIGGTSKEFASGLTARLLSCSGKNCELELEKTADFSGGQDEAESLGMAAQSSSQGAGAIIEGQGAILPNGTVLQAGTNPNSGTAFGEMMAAASIGECASDVKASINNGTPVLTCDGQQGVGSFSDGGENCEQIEECEETALTELDYTKKCSVSLDYSNASCTREKDVKTCQLSNAKTTELCVTETESDAKAVLPRANACDRISISNTDQFGTFTKTVDSRFLNNKVFVAVSYYVDTSCSFFGCYADWREFDTLKYTGTLRSTSVSVKFHGNGRGSNTAQFYVNGSRIGVENTKRYAPAEKMAIHICNDRSNPGLYTYPDFSFNFGGDNSYQSEKPTGYQVRHKGYLVNPADGDCWLCGPVLKQVYIDAGYSLFYASANYQTGNYIVRKDTTTQTCEVVNE